jgi:hypothetical protein
MSAEHGDNRAMPARGVQERADDAAEIAGDENIRQRGDERGKRPISAGRMREFSGADLVGSSRYGNGSYGAEIGFCGTLRRRA